MDGTYDAEVDAAYLLIGAPIRPGGSASQQHSIPTPNGGEIGLDFDTDGHLLGVEVLTASVVLRPEDLARLAPLGQVDGADPVG